MKDQDTAIDPAHSIESRDAEAVVLERKVAPHVKAKRRYILDEWASEFLAYTRLIIIGTADTEGDISVSPRGGEAGFIKVLDNEHICFADLPGNNLLESYRNILSKSAISLLCIIPGREGTLRIRGSAIIQYKPIARPLTGIYVVIKIKHWYYHCGRSFRLADTWNKDVIEAHQAIPFAKRPPPVGGPDTSDS